MKTNALFLLDEEHWEHVYSPAERKQLERAVEFPLRFHTAGTVRESGRELAEAEVIFSGWSMARCDEEFLAAAPKLRAIFYAAGSVDYFVTDALWRRGVVVSSANTALALTVAEFTLGQILLSLRSMWRQSDMMHAARRPIRLPSAGIHGGVVGLVSLGTVGRCLIELLRPFHLRVAAHDPLLSDGEIRAMGADPVSLEKLFAVSDVVSLHTPVLPETLGMVRGHHLARMKPGATFINTARGVLVNEPEMVEVLARRPDLYALLDVTHPEPAPPSSPLYDLPNVVLTPHVAGAFGRESRRLGAMAVEEFERYRVGAPLHGLVAPRAKSGSGLVVAQ